MSVFSPKVLDLDFDCGSPMGHHGITGITTMETGITAGYYGTGIVDCGYYGMTGITALA